MDACPICRASLNGATTCRRCRADLQKVQEAALRGQALMGAAMRSLAEGDLAGADQWLGRARAVHATPAVRTLRQVMDAACDRGRLALESARGEEDSVESVCVGAALDPRSASKADPSDCSPCNDSYTNGRNE